METCKFGHLSSWNRSTNVAQNLHILLCREPTEKLQVWLKLSNLWALLTYINILFSDESCLLYYSSTRWQVPTHVQFSRATTETTGFAARMCLWGLRIVSLHPLKPYIFNEVSQPNMKHVISFMSFGIHEIFHMTNNRKPVPTNQLIMSFPI